jgi:hypothetical protein
MDSANSEFDLESSNATRTLLEQSADLLLPHHLSKLLRDCGAKCSTLLLSIGAMRAKHGRSWSSDNFTFIASLQTYLIETISGITLLHERAYPLWLAEHVAMSLQLAEDFLPPSPQLPPSSPQPPEVPLLHVASPASLYPYPTLARASSILVKNHADANHHRCCPRHRRRRHRIRDQKKVKTKSDQPGNAAY